MLLSVILPASTAREGYILIEKSPVISNSRSVKYPTNAEISSRGSLILKNIAKSSKKTTPVPTNVAINKENALRIFFIKVFILMIYVILSDLRNSSGSSFRSSTSTKAEPTITPVACCFIVFTSSAVRIPNPAQTGISDTVITLSK